jgi:hypothetical protein
MSLTHPPVHMPESTKFSPIALLRVDANAEGAYIVAYGTYREGNDASENIATRWVTIPSGKVFPQSRGYATWDLIPDYDIPTYLVYLLALAQQEVAKSNSTTIDTKAVLNLLAKR